MNKIDKKISELITILERQNWLSIEFETVGTITIKFTLHKPKYRFLKTTNCIQLYDRLTEKKVIIDIYTANRIEINEEVQEYKIILDNGQYVRIKMY